MSVSDSIGVCDECVQHMHVLYVTVVCDTECLTQHCCQHII